MFADADKVVIDRKENRHAAFGLGIHRCVGSNLARMEMTVAVEELLKRIPEFSLAGEVTWSEGTVRGPRKLPIRFELMAMAPPRRPRSGKFRSVRLRKVARSRRWRTRSRPIARNRVRDARPSWSTPACP